MKIIIKTLDDGRIVSEVTGKGEELLAGISTLCAHAAELMSERGLSAAAAEELISAAATSGVRYAEESGRARP
ncbi:MAG: hypothetical protein DBX59_01740 [Bacillota bacterium]|nr:MAG: hypothetical protein DBX59_01740 [Bacillota bacterium]